MVRGWRDYGVTRLAIDGPEPRGCLIDLLRSECACPALGHALLHDRERRPGSLGHGLGAELCFARCCLLSVSLARCALRLSRGSGRLGKALCRVAMRSLSIPLGTRGLGGAFGNGTWQGERCGVRGFHFR